jgi:hypothetical protein
MLKMIALCGAPGAGKSEVQQYLRKHYDVMAADDGHPLRDFAMRHLGLSHADVYTQEGKARTAVFPGGKSMEVRKALGELGNAIEALFGPEAIPEMAAKRALAQAKASGWKAVCFGSVRRDQGKLFKAYGAKIVEIRRPGYLIVNEFDRYDASLADAVINNDSSLAALHERIEFTFKPWLERELAP